MKDQKNEVQRLVAGAMSGTSADGVEVAIVAITGQGLEMSVKLLHHRHISYNPELRNLIFAARGSGTISLAELARMGKEIALTYAQGVTETLREAGFTSADLLCVAAHGQTL